METWDTLTPSEKLVYRVEGAETWQEVFERAKIFIEQLSDLHLHETVLVVAHGGVNRCITCVITGRPPEDIFSLRSSENTCVSVFEIDQDKNHKPPRPITLDLYTVAETAAILGVSRKTVFEWIKSGDLVATKLGPGQRLIRIRRVDLEQFVATDFGENQTGETNR